MGLEMIETINHIRKDYTFLNMRIGIHTVFLKLKKKKMLLKSEPKKKKKYIQGKKIIGGILGTSVVRYDVYGRDIRIANKMESSGEPARVMIS